MNKDAPKMPVMLLLILFVLIIGLILATKISGSMDTGTLKKVQNKHTEEKDLYKITP